MPCILKVKIISARNLPVMDRKTELTDAYVEIKFDSFEETTKICRKTLNPVWNEDFRFEVNDDSILQNEPLEIKVLDHDAITANDAVGSVFIDLNPLLTWDSNDQICGWFPLYDTIRGIRGEVSIQVKIQFFGDNNPFKDSSAGVQLFSTNVLPPFFQIVSILGFVDAINTEDDPEYHWSDNFRTPRTSNEARERFLHRIANDVKRQLGKKVLDMGGNAVISFRQYYDMESIENSVTVRAQGTACKIIGINNRNLNDNLNNNWFPIVQSPLLSNQYYNEKKNNSSSSSSSSSSSGSLSSSSSLSDYPDTFKFSDDLLSKDTIAKK